MTPLRILAVNVGSSSLRLDLWDVPETSPRVVQRADGIGEHAGPIRAQIVGWLAFLGARLDEDANLANATVVSRPESAVVIQVVRVDEGRQIARETAKLASRGARVGEHYNSP